MTGDQLSDEVGRDERGVAAEHQNGVAVRVKRSKTNACGVSGAEPFVLNGEANGVR